MAMFFFRVKISVQDVIVSVLAIGIASSGNDSVTELVELIVPPAMSVAGITVIIVSWA